MVLILSEYRMQCRTGLQNSSRWLRGISYAVSSDLTQVTAQLKPGSDSKSQVKSKVLEASASSVASKSDVAHYREQTGSRIACFGTDDQLRSLAGSDGASADLVLDL